jgi:hypothetical protein
MEVFELDPVIKVYAEDTENFPERDGVQKKFGVLVYKFRGG